MLENSASPGDVSLCHTTANRPSGAEAIRGTNWSSSVQVLTCAAGATTTPFELSRRMRIALRSSSLPGEFSAA
jgi:hypothetical protein